MQITEVSKEGLYREYKVKVAAEEITAQVSRRLDNIAKTAQMPGFRKGKVPLNILTKRYGAELLEEALRDTINDTSRKLYADEKLRPATQPDIQIANFQEGEDLEYSVSLEIFPEVTLPDFSVVKLEKLVAEISDDDINEALDRLAAYTKKFSAPETSKKAEMGDAVVIDYEGSVDAVPFEGGKAENFRLELGSNQFIAGFEEQLVGVSAGENRVVNVTFPEEYHHAPLAGKAAVFNVAVKEVLVAVASPVDDTLAAQFGMENLEHLKEMLRNQLERDSASVSRTKIKKELFDILETLCTFPVPSKMVEAEFDALWKSAKQEDELDTNKSEEEQQQEYRRIAERRVKLGILMAEVSREHKLVVTQEEIQKAIYAQTRAYPGQEHAVIAYFRKHPDAVEQLKGPIIEDKTVDFIIDNATVSEKTISFKEMMDVLDTDVTEAAE